MIGIIIQARMGSTRLPGKVLKMLGDKSLLDHIFYRLTFLRHPVKIVLATSDLKNDDVVEAYCAKNKIECFRGSESNVLERYYMCAKKYRMDNIIRLTGDNPFTDMEELDSLIEMFLKEKLEFAHSFNVLPIGVGAEIFSFKAIEESHRNGKEHVDEYLLENPVRFRTKILDVPSDKNRPELRLTVDTTEDFRRAEFIIQNAASGYVTTEEAIRLCMQFA
jgi:spore coat polysaccharide biosynthesis protein SpsF